MVFHNFCIATQKTGGNYLPGHFTDTSEWKIPEFNIGTHQLC